MWLSSVITLRYAVLKLGRMEGKSKLFLLCLCKTFREEGLFIIGEVVRMDSDSSIQKHFIWMMNILPQGGIFYGILLN